MNTYVTDWIGGIYMLIYFLFHILIQLKDFTKFNSLKISTVKILLPIIDSVRFYKLRIQLKLLR